MSGESMILAAARGRRAGHENDSARSSVDWALPSLFMRDDLPPNFTPYDDVILQNARQQVQLENRRVLNYQLETGPANEMPMFYGRENFFKLYYNLMNPLSARKLLAIYTDIGRPPKRQRLGRTRLLKEIARQAIRDGHIPVKLIVNDPAWENPKRFLDLSLWFLEAMREAYQAFDLPMPLDGALLNELRQVTFPPSEYDELIGQYSNNPKQFLNKLRRLYSGEMDDIDAQVAGDALLDDLKILAQKAATGQVLVLLDDVDLYMPDLKEMFQWFNSWGLPDSPVSVVITYDRFMQADLFKSLAERIRVMNETKLPVFTEDNEEDMMALECILLHPFSPKFDDEIIVTKIPLVVNQLYKEGKLSDPYFKKRFRQMLAGYPGNFENDNLWLLVEFAVKDNYLCDANDEDQLRKAR